MQSRCPFRVDYCLSSRRGRQANLLIMRNKALAFEHFPLCTGVSAGSNEIRRAQLGQEKRRVVTMKQSNLYRVRRMSLCSCPSASR